MSSQGQDLNSVNLREVLCDYSGVDLDYLYANDKHSTTIPLHRRLIQAFESFYKNKHKADKEWVVHWRLEQNNKIEHDTTEINDFAHAIQIASFDEFFIKDLIRLIEQPVMTLQVKEIKESILACINDLNDLNEFNGE